MPNGAAAGTFLVKDINPGSGDSVGLVHANLVNANGTLFFGATDGTHGSELWQSNGAAAGTVMVKDINPGSAGSSPYYLANANGTLFFSANDGIRGAEPWILGPLPAHPSGGNSSAFPWISPPTVVLASLPVSSSTPVTMLTTGKGLSRLEIGSVVPKVSPSPADWVVHVAGRQHTTDADWLEMELDW